MQILKYRLGFVYFEETYFFLYFKADSHRILSFQTQDSGVDEHDGVMISNTAVRILSTEIHCYNWTILKKYLRLLMITTILLKQVPNCSMIIIFIHNYKIRTLDLSIIQYCFNRKFKKKNRMSLDCIMSPLIILNRVV